MAITRTGVLKRSRLALVLLLLAGASGRAAAFDFVGPNKCTSCHDHDPQKEWAEKKEGPKGHLNALAQLEEKKSPGYAKAIGLADVYDLKGTCVKCHATVFKGDASFGVSCESCHGPGSAYLEPHQKKGAYKQAVGQGMYDTRVGEGGSYKVLAEMCYACHYIKDKKLVAAGHSSGVGWDLREKTFGQVVHWKEAVDKDKVGAAGRAAYARVSGGAAAAEPKAETKPEPKAEKPADAKPAEAKPTAAKPAEAKPADTKPADAKPADAKPAAEPKAPQPTAEPKAAAPAPKAEPTRKPDSKPAPAASAPLPTTVEPKKPEPAPAATTAPPPPSSEAPVATPAASVAPPPPAPPLASPPPKGPVSEAAYARGQVLGSLEKAIRSGKKLDARPAPPAVGTVEYQGPDAELLRLQDEVLELELEALSPRPTPKPASPSSSKEKKP
ncbi:MAG: multiheme c-type cytochrome [Thermoanaerobaculia bacterium]